MDFRTVVSSLAATTLGIAAFATPALADDRPYIWSYSVETPSQGEREFEYRVQNLDLTSDRFTHLVSFEYGVTDRWALEPYLLFAHGGGSGASVDSLRLESRFRVLDESAFVPGAALYAEYEHTFAPDDPKEVEAKLLLGKAFGPLQLTLNGIANKKIAFLPVDFGYTVGLAVPVTDWAYLGAEVLGKGLGTPAMENRVGPTAVVRVAGFRLGLGGLLGLNGASNQAQLNSGIEF